MIAQHIPGKNRTCKPLTQRNKVLRSVSGIPVTRPHQTNLHQGNFVEGDLSLLVDETCLFMQFTRNLIGHVDALGRRLLQPDEERADFGRQQAGSYEARVQHLRRRLVALFRRFIEPAEITQGTKARANSFVRAWQSLYWKSVVHKKSGHSHFPIGGLENLPCIRSATLARQCIVAGQPRALQQPDEMSISLENSGIYQSADRFVGVTIQDLQVRRVAILAKALPQRPLNHGRQLVRRAIHDGNHTFSAGTGHFEQE